MEKQPEQDNSQQVCVICGQAVSDSGDPTLNQATDRGFEPLDQFVGMTIEQAVKEAKKSISLDDHNAQLHIYRQGELHEILEPLPPNATERQKQRQQFLKGRIPTLMSDQVVEPQDFLVFPHDILMHPSCAHQQLCVELEKILAETFADAGFSNVQVTTSDELPKYVVEQMTDGSEPDEHEAEALKNCAYFNFQTDQGNFGLMIPLGESGPPILDLQPSGLTLVDMNPQCETMGLSKDEVLIPFDFEERAHLLMLWQSLAKKGSTKS